MGPCTQTNTYFSPKVPFLGIALKAKVDTLFWAHGPLGKKKASLCADLGRPRRRAAAPKTGASRRPVQAL